MWVGAGLLVIEVFHQPKIDRVSEAVALAVKERNAIMASVACKTGK